MGRFLILLDPNCFDDNIILKDLVSCLINLGFSQNICETTAVGDGPVDAVFKSVKKIFPNESSLQLYQVHAVTEGTDAQATVSVRLEESGKIATGQSSDTDTVVASAKAYINALNKLLLRREKKAPNKI